MFNFKTKLYRNAGRLGYSIVFLFSSIILLGWGTFFFFFCEIEVVCSYKYDILLNKLNGIFKENIQKYKYQRNLFFFFFFLAKDNLHLGTYLPTYDRIDLLSKYYYRGYLYQVGGITHDEWTQRLNIKIFVCSFYNSTGRFYASAQHCR